MTPDEELAELELDRVARCPLCSHPGGDHVELRCIAYVTALGVPNVPCPCRLPMRLMRCTVLEPTVPYNLTRQGWRAALGDDLHELDRILAREERRP